MFLTAEDLRELTDKKYAPAQRKVLDQMRIPYTNGFRGRPKVLRSSVEAVMGAVVKDEPRLRL